MKRLIIGALALVLIPFSGWLAATRGQIECRVCPRVSSPCFYCEGKMKVSIVKRIFDPPPDITAIRAIRMISCACGQYLIGTHPECEWVNQPRYVEVPVIPPPEPDETLIAEEDTNKLAESILLGRDWLGKVGPVRLVRLLRWTKRYDRCTFLQGSVLREFEASCGTHNTILYGYKRKSLSINQVNRVRTRLDHEDYYSRAEMVVWILSRTVPTFSLSIWSFRYVVTCSRFLLNTLSTVLTVISAGSSC